MVCVPWTRYSKIASSGPILAYPEALRRNAPMDPGPTLVPVKRIRHVFIMNLSEAVVKNL